jgi:ClpP class serine protease
MGVEQDMARGDPEDGAAMRLIAARGPWCIDADTAAAVRGVYGALERGDAAIGPRAITLLTRGLRGGHARDAWERARAERAAEGQIQRLPLAVRMVRSPGSARGVAVLPVMGLLAKSTEDVQDSDGNRIGTAYTELEAALAWAGGEASVGAVLLHVDSGGGAALGLGVVSSLIRAVRSHKVVAAYVDDVAASAAYYLASQAEPGLLWLSPDGAVGSIGTMFVVHNTRDAAAKYGVRVEIITSNPHKGAGFWGTDLTDLHRADYRREAEELGAKFERDVALGRGLTPERVREVAQSINVVYGEEAVRLGLADGVVHGLAAAERRLLDAVR